MVQIRGLYVVRVIERITRFSGNTDYNGDRRGVRNSNLRMREVTYYLEF